MIGLRGIIDPVIYNIFNSIPDIINLGISKPDSLLKVVAIKGLCRETNVAKIDVGPKGAVLTFRDNSFANPGALLRFIAANQILWKIRPDEKVVVKGEWDTSNARLDAAEKILTQLVKLAKG